MIISAKYLGLLIALAILTLALGVLLVSHITFLPHGMLAQPQLASDCPSTTITC